MMDRLRWRVVVASIVACLGIWGCLPSGMNMLGVESIVTENEDIESEDALEDDRIEDKNPQYDPSLTVVENFDGCEITLNKSGSVTRLDILPFEEGSDLDGRIFRGRAEAIEALEGRHDAKLIPSLEVVNGLMKPFNDGLYAAVELGVQAGDGGIDFGKRAFLTDLLAAVVDELQGATGAQAGHLEDAAVFVAGGLLAGGAQVDMPADLLATAQAEADEFMESQIFSRPIGFYTWNDDLGAIFSQDRFYQNYQSEDRDMYTDTQVGLFSALAVVLRNNPELLDRYESLITLYAGLTNRYFHHPVTRFLPYVHDLSDLDDVAGIRDQLLADYPLEGDDDDCWPRFALFPSSDSPETELFRDLYCDAPPDPEVNLIDVLISRIRDGSVDLEPDDESGWYEYQLFALETLLLPERGPESDHLLLTQAYKEKLVETFKSIITQTRETHVKQLDIGGMDGAVMFEEPVDIYPQFRTEPFPTFYLRSARGYRFLGTVLQGVLGEEFLASRTRLFMGEDTQAPIGEEIHRMAETLYGLYILSARSVGLRPEFLPEEMAEFDQEACVERAEAFLAGWTTDAEVLSDPRVIVPVERDGLNSQVVYWAVIGVKVIMANAEFVEGYEPEIVDTGYCTVGEIVDQSYYMLMERMVEVRIADTSPPPTREEFRDLCDQYDTEEEIVAALEAL